MQTIHEMSDRRGEYQCTIDGHGDAYVIAEHDAQDGGVYVVTPETGHVWYDCRGVRCADLGSIECPALPTHGDESQEWEEWADRCVALADRGDIRID